MCCTNTNSVSTISSVTWDVANCGWVGYGYCHWMHACGRVEYFSFVLAYLVLNLASLVCRRVM